MKVFYDGKNDVVSIYLEEDAPGNNADEDLKDIRESRTYEIDEAAGLLLDMVDLIGENGNLRGFRVFNASKYYDLELLSSADREELPPEELAIRPTEKILKRIAKVPKKP